MVNENLSTKYQILNILRASTEPVSGDQIAETTGVSRVSVWKAVQALVESGYGITSSRHGYTLEKDLDDSLFPWEFGNNENHFSHFAQVESTMNQARNLAQKDNNSSIQIITADVQTSGKGHGDHSWTTTKGSLAFTVVLKSHIPSALSSQVLMTAQIALVQVLEELSGRKFFVRWPNDIWSENGKVAGILDEVSATGGVCNWVNIGVGVNLTKGPGLPKTDVVFTKETEIGRKEVLTAFLNKFLGLAEEYHLTTESETSTLPSSDSKLVDQWNALCMDSGKPLRLNGMESECICKGINRYGGLTVTNNGIDLDFLPGTINIIK